MNTVVLSAIVPMLKIEHLLIKIFLQYSINVVADKEIKFKFNVLTIW